MAIALIDKALANGAVIGRVISVHAAYGIAQKEMEAYKKFCRTTGIRPTVLIVTTRTAVGHGGRSG
jgi:hypothetical protein